MISDGKRRMFRRHKLFAKGTNGQPMIHSRLINPELKQTDKDFERLLPKRASHIIRYN